MHKLNLILYEILFLIHLYTLYAADHSFLIFLNTFMLLWCEHHQFYFYIYFAEN
jgi:hypothetical protein